ncbi:ABC transporter permease subunit [Companilactobacillus suantsaicola]|uniref:ABC transporter permease subunit n=1 Tax=Companilactobacillus suantsaicola TaxID=2487723 RepID=A0A4Z0JPY3_9LACO|nr:ABC transporter permease subunit [Companilactobacillus suantsaicola]TGD23974.1 ABC transporter permease subunit [Companilactobacillus suantsaicola]
MQNSVALPKKKALRLPVTKLLPFLIPIILVLFWQVASSLGWLSSSVLPSPLAVLQDGIELTQSGELPKNLSISLYRATLGLLIGGGIGFILGFINGMSKTCRLLFDSSIQMFRNIPHLALIPLIILWLGINESAKISLVAIGTMFPVYINTFHGISSVDPDLIEMGESYELSKRQMFFKIIFPAALPQILVGIRYALGVMWTTLIVAETISASSGIGYMANNAEDFMDMETVILCIVVYAVLGKISDLVAKSFESLLLEWQTTGRSNV